MSCFYARLIQDRITIRDAAHSESTSDYSTSFHTYHVRNRPIEFLCVNLNALSITDTIADKRLKYWRDTAV